MDGLGSVDFLAKVQDRTGGEVGLILVDRQGRVAHARNTPRMPVAWMAGAGAPRVEL